jgi:ankyrin repeat protein
LKGWKDITKKLIDLKVDLNKVDPKEEGTPLELAAWKNDVETIQMLLDAGAQLENSAPLTWAASGDGKEAAEFLLKLGVDPVAENDVGNTALHCASQGGHIDMISFFLQHINVDFVSSTGERALCYAAFNNQVEAMKLLLLSGANPNLKELNEDGWTALFFASQEGHLKAVKLLVGFANAEIDIQDKEGNTALHIAVKNDRLRIFEYLLSAGADYKIENNEGEVAVKVDKKEKFVTALNNYQKKSQVLARRLFQEEEEKKRKGTKIERTTKKHKTSKSQITRRKI